jgi:NAD(P)-dependent dehydrogenase (short-subunit alcohol dehydrogenase family)
MSKNPFSLEGEIALITGGASGIGLAIARAFVAQGARVVIVGRRPEVLQEACAKLGTSASSRVHDVTRYDEAPALLKDIAAREGPVSILVNNAGIHLKKPAEAVTVDEFSKVLEVHLLGAHALSRAAFPAMKEGGHGSILYIASMASLIGLPQTLAYTAAKSGMVGVVRTLACEWSAHGIRVNAIAPGWIETDMMRKAVDSDPERKAKILGRTPMNTFGQTEDIGWTASFLCSPAAKFITGACLPVDGGASIGF